MRSRYGRTISADSVMPTKRLATAARLSAPEMRMLRESSQREHIHQALQDAQVVEHREEAADEDDDGQHAEDEGEAGFDQAARRRTRTPASV